jgi:hypothetical protein
MAEMVMDELTDDLPPVLRRSVEPQEKLGVVEAVIAEGPDFSFAAVLEHASTGAIVLAQGRFATSPYIAFRWLRAPGETYGRSPVMKALPDIRTANKVVELTLKNASIAVAGIWQAEDDGVLNPANIRLQPGTIIPKAVGSAGLTPLEAPGRGGRGRGGHGARLRRRHRGLPSRHRGPSRCGGPCSAW